MTLKIYNTLTRKKEPLNLLEEGHIKMYVCGITAYDYCHIGHARSTLIFDMISRYLRYKGYRLTYVRNFTDIDDKIINRANEQHTTTEALANKFIKAFNEDMEVLGNIAPDLEPRATDNIPEIIEMIKGLISKDMAYEIDGDVFFRVSRFKGYGRLSGRSLEDMEAGARIEVNDKKENPMDFSLWKKSKPEEPGWESPWGQGRPGWHIECSAMSRKFLGDTFDIHGGGKDLIFPHHENEIAQSEAFSGKTFARAWIHHGFVTIDNEKMSKSLGNFLTIRDILEEWPAEVLRFFTFSTHYRSPINFSRDAMKEAMAGLDKIYNCLSDIAGLPKQGYPDQPGCAGKKNVKKIEALTDNFHKAMDNDFNTAQALGHIFEAVKGLNTVLQALPRKPAESDLKLLRRTSETVRELAGLMGLLQEEPTGYIKRKQEETLARLNIDRIVIDNLIRQRAEARAAKDWSRADEIRDKLAGWNIELKDSPEGTTWQVKIT